MFLLDTSALIEIFADSEKGRNAISLVGNATTFTAGICFAELSYWCSKNKADSDKLLSMIARICQVLESNRLAETRAGQLRHELNVNRKKKGHEIGLIDCLIMAIAEENNLSIITTDAHFNKYSGKAVIL